MPDAAYTDRIAALIDRDDIRALRLRYSTLLDGGETECLDEVFTEDAEVKVSVGSMKGLPQIKQELAAAYQAFDTKRRGQYPFIHAVTNHEITLTGPDAATGNCYLLDLVTDRPGPHHPVLLLGRYRDEYIRVDGAWRIARTELDVLWPEQG